MSSAAPLLRYSYAEYLRYETEVHARHEFVGGLILAMAGGTLEHARLISAVIASLSGQLAGRRCVVLDSNARVLVRASGNAYYPDASVACGRLEAAAEDANALLNPTVLVEVTSPSTVDYDRTDKLADYQRIPTVEHVVLIAHDAVRIDVCSRTPSGWTTSSFRAGDSAALAAVGCTLVVDDVYRDPLA